MHVIPFKIPINFENTPETKGKNLNKLEIIAFYKKNSSS